MNSDNLSKKMCQINYLYGRVENIKNVVHGVKSMSLKGSNKLLLSKHLNKNFV